MSTQKVELITELLQHVEYGIVSLKTFVIPSSSEQEFVKQLNKVDNALKSLISTLAQKNEKEIQIQTVPQIEPQIRNIIRAVNEIFRILGHISQQKKIPTVMTTLKIIQEFHEIPEKIIKKDLVDDITKILKLHKTLQDYKLWSSNGKLEKAQEIPQKFSHKMSLQ